MVSIADLPTRLRDLGTDVHAQPQAVVDNQDVAEELYAFGQSCAVKGRLPEVTGMTTSLWCWHSAGLFMQQRSLALPTYEASELLHYGNPTGTKAPIFITSRSGETVEIRRLLESIEG